MQQELRLSENKLIKDFHQTGIAKGVSRKLKTITVDDVKKAQLPVMDFLKTNNRHYKPGFQLK